MKKEKRKALNLKQPFRITHGKMAQSVNSMADFEKTARACSMGDVPSMLQMVEHFQNGMSDESKELMKQYLDDNSDAAGKQWIAFLEGNAEERFFAMAHCFWICRAAVFGDSASRKLIGKAPLLRDVARMDDEFQSADPKNRGRVFVTGEDMVRMGLLDFKGTTTLLLSALNQDRCYVGECYSGYSGRDSTGFGMEEEYAYYFFDEYFRLLFTLDDWSRHDIRVNAERIRQRCAETRKPFHDEREAFSKDHGKQK